MPNFTFYGKLQIFSQTSHFIANITFSRTILIILQMQISKYFLQTKQKKIKKDPETISSFNCTSQHFSTLFKQILRIITFSYKLFQLNYVSPQNIPNLSLLSLFKDNRLTCGRGMLKILGQSYVVPNSPWFQLFCAVHCQMNANQDSISSYI